MHQHLGVARAGEDGASLDQIPFDSIGVDEIAVVSNGERSAAGVRIAWLRVGQHRAPGGRIAGVAHGYITGQPGQSLIVKVLRDEPHPPMGASYSVAVDGHYSSTLLPPVLEGVQSEVCQPGCIRKSRDAYDATHAILLPRDPRRDVAFVGESHRSRSVVRLRYSRRTREAPPVVPAFPHSRP